MIRLDLTKRTLKRSHEFQIFMNMCILSQIKSGFYVPVYFACTQICASSNGPSQKPD